MKKVIKSIAIVLTLLFCVSFIVLSNVNAFTALDIPIDGFWGNVQSKLVW